MTASRRRLRWIVAAVAALIVLCMALIIVVAVVVVDEDSLRARFEATAAEALGMDVTIAGPVRLSFGPAPYLRAEDVHVARGDRQVAEFGTVRLNLALATLLAGDTRIRHLDLAGAEVRIVRDAEGRFDFQAADPAPGGVDRLPSVSFSAAAVHFVDATAGTQIEASGCQGKLPRLAIAASDPPGALGGLTLAGEVRCDTVRWQDFDFGDVAIDVNVQAGQVELDPLTLTLFEGTGHGRIAADFSVTPSRASLDFALDDLELEAFLQALEPEARGDGRMNFSAQLSAAGRGWPEMERSLEGRITLHGEALRMHGVDIDKRLADYESTRSFGLVDVGAVMFAGPLGLAVTKGRDYARLLRASEGTTEFRVAVSEWSLREGVAHAEDVAAATGKNRIAALGKVDIAARRFDGLRIALLDKRGCAVVEQAISGSFDDPEIEEPGTVETLLGPLIDLVERGIEQLGGDKCEIVYDGSVSAP